MKMKKIKVIFLLCAAILITACSSSVLGKYERGEALQNELDKLGITEISDIEEDVPNGSDSTVFVKLKGNNETLNAYLSLDYLSKEWELVSLRSYDHDISYFDKYNTEDVYDFNTRKLISKGEISSDNEKTEEKESNKTLSKDEIKSELQKELKDYESIDILTLNEGGYSASIQIKKDITRDEAIQYVNNELKPTITKVVDKYDVEVINSNSQLVVLIDQDGNTNN